MQSVSVCSICPEVQEKLKEFKFRKKANTAAIVLKIESATTTVVIDEEYEDVTIDEIANELPAVQPRFIVISYVYKRPDGGTSYPLMFVFCSPEGCKTEQQIMYAGTKNEIVNEAKVTKVFDIRSTEELTEDFILDKLKLFR